MLLPLILSLAFQEVVLAQLGIELQILGNFFLFVGILYGIWLANRSARTRRIQPHASLVLIKHAPREAPRSRAA